MRPWSWTIALAVFGFGPFSPLVADPWFFRGDADGNGELTITDPIFIFHYLFFEGLAPIGCLDAADVDDDGTISITDAVGLLAYLFQDGPPPSAPFPAFGSDPTGDNLGCEIVRIRGEGMVTVLCCDRSSSMYGEKWARLQEEVVGTIAGLPARSNFAVIFFDSNLTLFPASGEAAVANGAMQNAAMTMVRSTLTVSGTCGKLALVKALDIAGRTPVPLKRIIYFSDGGTTCPGQDTGQYASSTLAGENGGTYTRIIP